MENGMKKWNGKLFYTATAAFQDAPMTRLATR